MWPEFKAWKQGGPEVSWMVERHINAISGGLLFETLQHHIWKLKQSTVYIKVHLQPKIRLPIVIFYRTILVCWMLFTEFKLI